MSMPPASCPDLGRLEMIFGRENFLVLRITGGLSIVKNVCPLPLHQDDGHPVGEGAKASILTDSS